MQKGEKLVGGGEGVSRTAKRQAKEGREEVGGERREGEIGRKSERKRESICGIFFFFEQYYKKIKI